MRTACPVCSDSTREYCRKTSHGEEWIIHQCQSCGHGFVANRPTLDRLREIYSGDEQDAPHKVSAETFERRKDCRALVRKLSVLTSERGKALDVGSGDGGFSYHLHKRGFSPIEMIDLDPRSADAARLVPNCTFRQCAFEDIEADSIYSAIIMSQILEHALDPINWLKRANKLLTSQGVLVIALPNFSGVYRLLGDRDPFLAPPVHLNFFTARSMRLALTRTGYEVRKITTVSRVSVNSDKESMSWKRVMAGRLWNLGSWVLNPTRWGIILESYSQRNK